MEEKQKFDAKLEEGVAYFEQMLAMMPDDRTMILRTLTSVEKEVSNGNFSAKKHTK